MYTVSGSSRTPVGATTGYLTDNPISGSISLAPDDTLLVALMINAGGAARSGGDPTFNGYTMTQADTSRRGLTSPEISAEIWYITASGINLPYLVGSDISVPNGGSDRMVVDMVSAHAGPGKTAIFQIASGSANATTSTNPYCRITPTAGSNIIFEVVADGGNAWAPTGRTAIFTNINDNDIGNYGGGMQYAITNLTSIVTGSWTFGTADDWGVVMAVFGERGALVYPNNSAHLTTSGEIDLTQHELYTLAPDSSAHAQACDNVELTYTAPPENYTLSVNSSQHAQTSNNLYIGDAPALRGISSNSTGVTDTTGDVGLTINVPSETIDGDVMYLSIQLTSSTGSIDTPDGWTVVVPEFSSLGSASAKQALFRRIASSEPASYTVYWGTVTNTGRASGAIISLFKTSKSNPEMIWDTDAGSASTGDTETLPSITAEYQTLLITFVGAYIPTGNSITWTPPDGMIEESDVTSTCATKSNSAHETSIQIVDAGATGTKSAVGSLNTLYTQGVILLLNKKTEMVVQSSSHGQASDNVTLTAYEPISGITVQSSSHKQVSGNVVLTQYQILAVNSTQHVQSTANVTLTAYVPSFTLSVNGAINLLTCTGAGSSGTWIDGEDGNVNSQVDTLLYEPNPTTNYATWNSWEMGEDASLAGHREHEIVKFDVSGIPANATITSATLRVWVSAITTAGTLKFYNILAANSTWTEAGATWNTKDGSTPWAGSSGAGTAGTDYSTSELFSADASGWTAGEFRDISLNTDQVQLWLTNNYGFIAIQLPENGSYKVIYFSSSDNGVAAQHPKLTVAYVAGLSLTQHQTITVNSTQHAQAASNVTLTAYIPNWTLTVQSSQHAQATSSVALTPHAPSWTLTVSSPINLQVTSSVSLTQHQVLVVNSAQHLQISGNVVLTQHQILVVNSAQHAQVSANVALTQYQILVTQGSVHAQTAGNVIIIPSGAIGAQTSTHLQSSGNVVLTQHQILSVNSSQHALVSTTLSLAQGNILSVNSAIHLHTSGNVTLTAYIPNFTLTTGSSSHTQTTSSLALTQHQLLLTSNASHAQTSSNVTITGYVPNFILTLSTAIHILTSNNVSLGGNVLPIFTMHYIRLRSGK